MSAWSELWAALIARQLDLAEHLVGLPFHVIGTGRVTHATTASDVVAALGVAARAAGPVSADAVVPLQVGALAVSLGVRLPVQNGEQGHGLFLVTLHESPRVVAASFLPDPG